MICVQHRVGIVNHNNWAHLGPSITGIRVVIAFYSGMSYETRGWLCCDPSFENTWPEKEWEDLLQLAIKRYWGQVAELHKARLTFMVCDTWYAFSLDNSLTVMYGDCGLSSLHIYLAPSDKIASPSLNTNSPQYLALPFSIIKHGVE